MIKAYGTSISGEYDNVFYVKLGDVIVFETERELKLISVSENETEYESIDGDLSIILTRD